MTAMNFPSSPSNGDTYTNPDTGVTYTYDGTDAKWKTTVTSNAFLPLTGGTLTGTLDVAEIAHPSSATSNIVLDSSGNVSIDAGTLYVDASNNRVGIGNTTPGSFFSGANQLVVGSGSGAQGITIYSASNDNAQIFFSDGTTGDQQYRGILRYDHSADAMTFFTAGANERARIDSSGRLLVGTSSARSDFFGAAPDIQLERNTDRARLMLCQNVNNGQGPELILSRSRGTTSGSATVVQDNDELGNIHFAGTDGTNFAIGATIRAVVDGTPGNDDMPGRLVFSTTADGASSPTERMRIRADGEFLMYDVYNRTDAAAVNVVVKSDGSLRRSVSSIKYKTDVETLQDSYADAILNIRPVWYRSLCEGNSPEHSWWGFIAEEVAEIDPRLVHWKTVEITYDEKGSAISTPCDPEPEGVAYDRFVPHLLNLIKRQGEAIAELQAEVAALKGA